MSAQDNSFEAISNQIMKAIHEGRDIEMRDLLVQGDDPLTKAQEAAFTYLKSRGAIQEFFLGHDPASKADVHFEGLLAYHSGEEIPPEPCTKCGQPYVEGSDGWDGMCPTCADQSEPKTYNLTLGMSVRVYGTCDIEAASIEEALEIVRSKVGTDDCVFQENCTDMEWDTQCDEAVLHIENEDDEEDAIDEIDFKPYQKGWEVITAEDLKHEIKGQQIEAAPKTRANLMGRPMWQGVNPDFYGNPIVFLNRYTCCDTQWDTYAGTDGHSNCPKCFGRQMPLVSHWIGPLNQVEQALWGSLEPAT